MTDVRLPDRWLNDRRFVRLPADEFRGYVLSLMWAVSNRTDGVIERADLPIVPGVDESAAAALVTAGMWAVAGDGWKIVDFGDTQTSAAELRAMTHKRAVDRDRQARKRAHDVGNHALCLPDNCPARNSGSLPRDVTRDNRRDVDREVRRDTKDRLGQARTGQELEPLRNGTSFVPSGVPESPGPADAPDDGAGFCHGCGRELDTWHRGPLAGHCLTCSSACPRCPVVSSPRTCSEEGCSGDVTPYIRRKHGQVCADHIRTLA